MLYFNGLVTIWLIADWQTYSVAYSQPSQTSKLEPFAKGLILDV